MTTRRKWQSTPGYNSRHNEGMQVRAASVTVAEELA